MLKYILALTCFCVVGLYAQQVHVQNDTQHVYMVMCNGVAKILSAGEEMSCTLPQTPWWKTWWREATLAIYRSKDKKSFVEVFHVRPKGEKVEISLDDVEREVKRYEEGKKFSVRTKKRVIRKRSIVKK